MVKVVDTKVKTSGPWLISAGVSLKARELAKKLSKERGVNIGEIVNEAIFDLDNREYFKRKVTGDDSRKNLQDYVSAQESLKYLMQHTYNQRFSSPNPPYTPYVVSFGALNDEDMDRKIIEHIYNRLRMSEGKKSIEIPNPEKPWWKFWR